MRNRWQWAKSDNSDSGESPKTNSSSQIAPLKPLRKLRKNRGISSLTLDTSNDENSPPLPSIMTKSASKRNAPLPSICQSLKDHEIEADIKMLAPLINGSL